MNRQMVLNALSWLMVFSTVVWAEEERGPVDVALKNELINRKRFDDEARQAIIKWTQDNSTNGIDVNQNLPPDKLAEFERLSARLKDVDANNLQWLRETVTKQGWPTITQVGKEGSNAAWMLVQHADTDLKFQRQCLDLMAKLPMAECSQTNLAQLTDRVHLAEGKKQIYGTQFELVDGKLRPRPIDDEPNVDKRRTEVGLPPLAEYTKAVEDLFTPGRKK